QSVEALFVVIFAPVLAAIWLALGRRGKDLSSPMKFAIGLAFAGVGFLLMLAASNRVIASAGAVRVSMWWLVGTYLFQGIGELAALVVPIRRMLQQRDL